MARARRARLLMDRETRHYRNLNLTLAASFGGLHLFALFLLPLGLLPLDPAWGWLLLAPVLLTNTWWSLIHDAIHGGLLLDKGANRALGRVQAVLFGASFDLLRWGHLLHHALSRTRRERAEVYEPGRDNRLWFALDYYFRLLGGLYLFEVLGSLLFLLPRGLIRRLAARLASDRNPVAALVDKLLETETLMATRWDAVAIVLLYGLAFACYGPHAWMLVLTLAGRSLLISVMDNVWHYATPLEDSRYARNLRMPGLSGRLLLNFNLHGAHHLSPALPWWRLSRFHQETAAGFQGNLPLALLDQFRGPIAAHQLPTTRGDMP